MDLFDPNQVLYEMECALKVGAEPEFIELCLELFEWLLHGGAEPNWRLHRMASRQYFQYEQEARGL